MLDVDIQPFDDPDAAEEFKQIEPENYYKDGFVPTKKALSNLTKSMHSLNTLDHTDKSEINDKFQEEQHDSFKSNQE